MEFIKFYSKTALYIAIESFDIECVRLLLSNKNIDVNLPSISKFKI